MKETPLIDESLLRLLVCPFTGEKLKLEGDKLVCKSYSYPISDGIPVLLEKERV